MSATLLIDSQISAGMALRDETTTTQEGPQFDYTTPHLK